MARNTAFVKKGKRIQLNFSLGKSITSGNQLFIINGVYAANNTKMHSVVCRLFKRTLFHYCNNVIENDNWAIGKTTNTLEGFYTVRSLSEN